MSLAPVSQPSLNLDLWPPDSLVSWRDAPKETFARWLGQHKILGVRELRDSTRDTYLSIFSTWVHFLAERNMGLLEAVERDVALFFELPELNLAASHARQDGLHPGSHRRYLMLLDKVYRYLMLIGWAGPNPFQAEYKQAPAVLPDLPPGLSPQEVERLVQVLQALPGTKGRRDRALMSVMLGAGLRTNEVISLRLSDISGNYQVHVHSGTVHKPRQTVVLPDGPWRAWWAEWQNSHPATAHSDNLAFFAVANRVDRPLTASGLFRRVSNLLAEADIKGGQSGPNLLRNTFAQMALLSGRYDLNTLRGFMGYSEGKALARHYQALNSRGYAVPWTDSGMLSPFETS